MTPTRPACSPVARLAPPALALLLILATQIAFAQGRGLRDRPVFPRKPIPQLKIRVANIESISQTIPGVPEYAWWNGCSPTAAGMIIGFWDGKPGFENLFEGSAATWYGTGSSGTKRMVASQQHVDAGKALGFTYGSYRNHPANSIADSMYTEDGGTYRSDIGPGMAAFCGWDDPATATNEGYAATHSTKYTSSGWTYEQLCAEIDAGRPVHLGLRNASGVGHSVTAIGYDNTSGKQNYICWTTWSGWGLRSWGWTGETESGYNFAVYGATYLTVLPKSAVNSSPTSPTSVSISPTAPLTTNNLTATAAGSTDADGDVVSYQYQWARSADSGATWSAWGYDGATLASSNLAVGNQWKAQARASDGSATSAWVQSAPVTVSGSVAAAPTPPTTVTISPSQPTVKQSLRAAASGATDPNGDVVTYRYAWHKSADNGATWVAGPLGQKVGTAELRVGDLWKVAARATDGTLVSDWVYSATVKIAAGSGGRPKSLALSAAAAPTGAETVAITVNLTAAADVEVVVCNLAGRQVATLPARSLQAGGSTLAWNGRSVTGTRVPAGQYLLRLTARGADGSCAGCVVAVRR